MSHAAPPLVSVCIPVYNGAAFIAEAVNSVLAQTFRDFELVLLDNASIDETPRILQRFDDDRLRIIQHRTNIGAAANFNAALQEARGEWVKILCADDLLYPDCLQAQLVAALQCGSEHPVLLCAPRDIIDAAGRRWMRRGFPGKSGIHAGAEAVSRSVRTGTNLFGEPAAVLMHRETALLAGGFDPAWRFCIDLDFWVRILQYGNVYTTSAALCAFRVSPQSWSMALVHSQAREFCEWMARSQRSGSLKAGRGVLLLGRLNAYALMIQRLLFYRLMSRKAKKGKYGYPNRWAADKAL